MTGFVIVTSWCMWFKSLCCIPWTCTVLYVNYVSIKVKEKNGVNLYVLVRNDVQVLKFKKQDVSIVIIGSHLWNNIGVCVHVFICTYLYTHICIDIFIYPYIFVLCIENLEGKLNCTRDFYEWYDMTIL